MNKIEQKFVVIKIPEKRVWENILRSSIFFGIFVSIAIYQLMNVDLTYGLENFLELSVTLGSGLISIYLLHVFIWNSFGIEEVQIEDGKLKLIHKALGYKNVREYEHSRIQNMRVTETYYIHYGHVFLANPFKITPGKIAFNYKSNVCFLGKCLDEVEAQRIIDEIMLSNKSNPL